MEEESKCECMKCLTYNPGRDCDCSGCLGYSEPEAQSDAHGTGGRIAEIQGTDSWAMRKHRPKAELKMQFMGMMPAPDSGYHIGKSFDDARWTDMLSSGLYWQWWNKR